MSERLINQIILVSALGIAIYMETIGKPVPSTVLLLAGFYVRHLIGDNTTEVKPWEYY